MIGWSGGQNLSPKKFYCNYCHSIIASEKGYAGVKDNKFQVTIYICTNCNEPTYFQVNEFGKINQIPNALYGKSYDTEICPDIIKLYNEARRCMSVSAYNAVAMCCRKLLMHIAVDLKAKEGDSFLEYIDYLDRENYIPRNSKVWVDVIRKTGNNTNHKIEDVSEETAKKLIDFTSLIIDNIYEAPSKIPNP